MSERGRPRLGSSRRCGGEGPAVAGRQGRRLARPAGLVTGGPNAAAGKRARSAAAQGRGEEDRRRGLGRGEGQRAGRAARNGEDLGLREPGEEGGEGEGEGAEREREGEGKGERAGRGLKSWGSGGTSFTLRWALG